MAGRHLARIVAPLALVAFGVALYLVVTGGLGGETASTGTRQTGQPATSDGATRQDRKPRPKRRRYTVKPGDTPSGIAEKTGVPLDQLLALNPDLDPQTLTPGTRIRLRR